MKNKLSIYFIFAAGVLFFAVCCLFARRPSTSSRTANEYVAGARAQLVSVPLSVAVTGEADTFEYISSDVCEVGGDVHRADGRSISISGFPPALSPLKILDSQVRVLPDGRQERRSLVATTSQFGNILFVNAPDGSGGVYCKLYAGEYFIASSQSEGYLTSAIDAFERSGWNVVRPQRFSKLLRVSVFTDRLDEIDGMLERAVELAGENVVVELDPIGGICGFEMDDPDGKYSTQWSMPMMDMEDAWEITTGSTNIIVAVVDTGLILTNMTQSDFEGRLAPGYDFVNDDNDPTDDVGHGTAVASCLAATGNNGVGLAGVDWNCKIMPLKTFNSSGFGSASRHTLAFDYAREHGARVINFSGWEWETAAMRTAISNALEAGIVFVTSAGNGGPGAMSFPATMPEIITVGYVSDDTSIAPNSSDGPTLDLVAPGRKVKCYTLTGGIAAFKGSSFASPKVAGIAALMLAINPDLNSEKVETILKATAIDQDTIVDTITGERDAAGFDIRTGWGRVNAYNALIAAQPNVRVVSAESDSLSFRWDIPPNATNREPYSIGWSTNLVSWTTITNPVVVYGSATAEWTDNGSETGSALGNTRFYRLEIGPK